MAISSEFTLKIRLSRTFSEATPSLKCSKNTIQILQKIMDGNNSLSTAPENNEETLLISYTCGVCETICVEDQLHQHPCLEGYTQISVDENLYFYPQTDDGQIIRKSELGDGTEAIVMKTTENQNANFDWRNKKIYEEERLIAEVQKRPALWNFKLPLIERNMQIKKQLWEEIFASMNSTMDITTMKKKWKSLCDTFRVCRNKQHQPSGSASTRKSNWIHFERMQFLCNVQLENEATTNIPVFEESNDSSMNDSIICDDISSSGRGSCNKRHRLNTDDSEENFDRLVDVLRQPITVNVPPPRVDKAGLFGNLIAAQLRELDPQLVDDTMLQVMQVINNAKRKN